MPKYRLWPEESANNYAVQPTHEPQFLWPAGDFVTVEADTPELAVEAFETNPEA